MKKVTDIYLSGSCNPKLNSGSYKVIVVDIEDNKELLSKKDHCTSVNQILLKGLVEALSICSNDTKVTVHANTSLGWKNVKKSKNRDWIEKVQGICKLRNINLDIREKEDLGFLKDLIKTYSL